MSALNAAEQVNRIVQMVAELSKRDREGRRPATLGELAKQFGVTTAQIERDIRTLTVLCDDVEIDWLSSIRAWQDGETVWLSSAGPFRRPIRFSTEEMLALSAGLATEEGGSDLARQLATIAHDVAAVEDGDSPVLDLLLTAVTRGRCVELVYAGEGATEASVRVIHPHQVTSFAGHLFVIAWCERASGWRHFRLDRTLDATALDRSFTPREDFQPIERPEELFHGGEAVDGVRVRFSAEITRWIVERYPHAEQEADGSATVTYRVADIAWLVRRILQYGPEAEVLEPEQYRIAMRRAVTPAR